MSYDLVYLNESREDLASLDSRVLDCYEAQMELLIADPVNLPRRAVLLDPEKGRTYRFHCLQTRRGWRTAFYVHFYRDTQAEILLVFEIATEEYVVL